MLRSRYSIAAGLGVLVVLGLIGIAGIGGVSAGAPADASASIVDPDDDKTVSEEEYVEPAPEPGDLYYEAGSENWVSYDNPRDEYRSPYLGDGSGKVCVTLVNEAGDPIVGETVPNTTVTVPTGETLSWHSHADPMTVEYPVTDHYERPLDADQFGTTDDLPQGDGYMDSHCIEMHGQPEDATIEYGEAQIDGEHADRIEVVGYIQQAHDAWDSDVDPIEDAEPYEKAGGGWTFEPDGSHGQAVAVLQLTGEDTTDDESTSETEDKDDDSTNSSNSTDENADDSDGEDNASVSASETSDSDDGDDEQMPGFGLSAAIVALTLAALVGSRYRSE
ncbi:PGF-CTERM sorting domain-containing protein [Natronorubrum sp. JWXQ-INN-674]|uniref:PGF-CTERM sorting domain-containing protein n=1 Tax=Natronorubrum halalkaliphilum TaxID=2691917 RepID=A0A6B0VS43_9EURY|nr:PGF-CTERM sorting domain-containing protein [Natronorubrum halalkaliphilum]MXV63329.1 PGF-CTERM sorting domain-containing protein [Natronorubrum halalkaliphilum]